MSDQRKDIRTKLMAFTPAYDYGTHALLGYVGNINLLGAMVVSEHYVEAGRDMILDIQLPEGLEGVMDRSLQMPAHIAWCRADETVKSFTIGFEFTKITPEQKAVIQAILNRYHFSYDLK